MCDRDSTARTGSNCKWRRVEEEEEKERKAEGEKGRSMVSASPLLPFSPARYVSMKPIEPRQMKKGRAWNTSERERIPGDHHPAGGRAFGYSRRPRLAPQDLGTFGNRQKDVADCTPGLREYPKTRPPFPPSGPVSRSSVFTLPVSCPIAHCVTCFPFPSSLAVTGSANRVRSWGEPTPAPTVFFPKRKRLWETNNSFIWNYDQHHGLPFAIE